MSYRDQEQAVIESMFPSPFQKGLGKAVEIKAKVDAFNAMTEAMSASPAVTAMSAEDWCDMVEHAAKSAFKL